MIQKLETFSRFTVLTWLRKSCSSQKSTECVSAVYSLGSNSPAVSMFWEMGDSFCFVMGNAMIHGKRSLTSGLINHFFSSLAFLGNTFCFSSHSLSLSPFPLPLSLHLCRLSYVDILACLITHSTPPSSFAPLICLDGKRKTGMRMKVNKVWRE